MANREQMAAYWKGRYEDLKREADDAWQRYVQNSDVCHNCGSPMPDGCGGLFLLDGKACLRNAKPADIASVSGEKP